VTQARSTRISRGAPARDPGDVRARSRGRDRARGAPGARQGVGDDDFARVVVDLVGNAAPAVQEVPQVRAEGWIGESNAHGEESRLASWRVRGPRLTADGCPARPPASREQTVVLWRNDDTLPQGQASEPGIDRAGEAADSLLAHALGVCLWPCSKSERSSATEGASMSSSAQRR
jgi:hypothetical protein